MTCVTCGQEFIESVPDEPHSQHAQAAPRPAQPANAGYQQIHIDPQNPMGSIFNMISTLMQPQQPNQGAPNAQGAQQPPLDPFAALQQQFAQVQQRQANFGAGQRPQSPPGFVHVQQYPMGQVFNFTADPTSYVGFSSSFWLLNNLWQLIYETP
jgi:hypothetical protein